MPSYHLTEEPLQFGEEGRLFGILTVPSMPPPNAQELPIFVFLSAGLLHRVGPYRLYVRLVRELAEIGFSSLRLDLAGTGDSPPRSGLANHESVTADFQAVLSILESRLGRLPLVLAGLCTGADNAIMLALKEQRVVGMVLFDPFCFPDRGFRTRAVLARYGNPARQVGWLKRRFKILTNPPAKEQVNNVSADGLAFRDLPSREQFRASIESIREREGQVLSIFTKYASRYYNRKGQLGRALGVNGYKDFCTEIFWPHVDHTYRLEIHRRRLFEEIKSWAGYYVRSRRTAKSDSRALLLPRLDTTTVLKVDSSVENRPI